MSDVPDCIGRCQVDEDLQLMDSFVPHRLLCLRLDDRKMAAMAFHEHKASLVQLDQLEEMGSMTMWVETAAMAFEDSKAGCEESRLPIDTVTVNTYPHRELSISALSRVQKMFGRAQFVLSWDPIVYVACSLAAYFTVSRTAIRC